MEFNTNEEILLHPNDHKRKKTWISILKFMDKNLDYNQINNSLDLGGAQGNLSYHILKRNDKSEVICLDKDINMLETAKKRHPALKTLVFDINNQLPFKDNSVDLVSCLGTLHYFNFNNPEDIFKEMVRVSKKYIMLEFLYKYRLWHLLLKIRYPQYNPRRHTQKAINELIKKYNLRIASRMGTKNIFGRFFPSFGRITVFLLEKNND